MLYKYEVLDGSGKKQKGEIEANNPADLRIILRKKKLVLLKFSKTKKEKFSLKDFLFKRVKTKDIAVFTRGLSTMINAGVSILRAYEILENQIKKPKLKKVVTQIKEDLNAGLEMSKSMEKHPKYFNVLYVSMVRSGETSGTLDDVLNRIADALEKAEQIKGKVKGAMVYPGVVLFTAISVMFFMLAFIIPKFMLLFEGTGVEMPWLTLMVMEASNIASKYWYLFVIGTVGIFYGIKKILLNKKGKRFFDVWVLKVPLIGAFVRKTAMARFTRTLSTLLNSGVSIIVAFDITSEVIGNTLIQEALEVAKESISNGDSIYEPLEASGQFPDMVTDMIQVGEESGELASVLEKVADYAEIELDEAVGKLLAAFEPLIILFMAIGVGVLIISMFLPLFKMSDMVG
ncbi:MAG: type II secretion system F family protein [Psychrilyobacter sp.]|nr:type II secretion system F family protein [Psychrilyobacter sp.]